MWWKLTGLLVLTAILVFAIIPIRTHAVVYDPMNEPSSARHSYGQMLGSMYLTPGTALLVILILAIATFVAFKVLRGHW